MRMRCQDSHRTTTQPSSSMASLEMNEAAVGMTYLQALSSSISSGAGFDTHCYQSLLNGRGLLLADQQLMANEKTARLLRAYASDDRSTFWMDFARAMMKMSGLNVLTGSQGQVRRNCSLPLVSSQVKVCRDELLKCLFLSYCFFLCLIVDAVTSTFLACANMSLYIMALAYRGH